MLKLKIFILMILYLLLFIFSAGEQDKTENLSIEKEDMVWIKGGSFLMGDLFNEGNSNEKPVHKVNLQGFFIGKYEVTEKEFRKFVEESDYKTSAKMNVNKKLLNEYLKKINDKNISHKERIKYYQKILSFGGTHCYNPETKSFDLMISDANWKNPYFSQSEKDPVTCISWKDAVSYCNWLSKKSNLPYAYNIKTGELLDAKGKSTIDIRKVKGFRLPTEAEWEYAARERGKKVRFGNGKNTANQEEINFDTSSGTYSYLKKGGFRKKTSPVGNFPPNKIGLYDMSGNVWEWCSDYYIKYDKKEKVNPYIFKGFRRTARGGRWGGSAYECRVSCRFGWTSSDRCNNIGFRIAMSK